MFQRGFTLLEMMASLLVLALLAGSFYAPQVLSQARELQRAQALITAEQLNRIAAVAQDWTLSNNGHWPDVSNRCANLFPLLSSRLLGLESSATPSSPWLHGAPRSLPITHSAWNQGQLGRYYPSCSNDDLQIELFMRSEDELWAHYIKNRLTGAVLDQFSGRNYVRLRAQWPLPAAIPALDALVSKSRPELTGALRSNVDVGRHAVFGASDVILDNGHSLGKTIAFAENARPRQIVSAPRCAPGLRPQALASFNRLLHSSGKPINFSAAIVVPLDADAINNPGNRWLVSSQVIDSDGTIDNNNPAIRINVLVRCS